MKYLVIPNGGMPFEADDIRWMQEGWNDEVRAILRAFRYQNQVAQYGTHPANSFIIYGCNISGNSVAGWEWTEGAVCLQGQIYFCPASTAPVPHTGLQGLYFEPGVAYSASGYEQFEDGNSEDTYAIRIVTPTVKTLGTTGLFFGASTVRFISGYTERQKTYIIVGGGGGAPAYASNWQAGTESLGFRLNNLRYVEFKGAVERQTAIATSNVFTLPSGYRPTVNRNYMVINLTTPTQFNMVTITTAGVVQITGAFSSGDQFDFSPITFPIE